MLKINDGVFKYWIQLDIRDQWFDIRQNFIIV